MASEATMQPEQKKIMPTISNLLFLACEKSLVARLLLEVFVDKLPALNERGH